MRSALAAVAGSAALVGLTLAPASATSIVSPASPFTVPVDSFGNPLPFAVTATGFTPGETVYYEICNGVSSTSANYDPTLNCDNTTSGGSQIADSSGSVTFPGTPTAQGTNYYETDPFRGASPNDLFNCLAPQDVNSSATPAQGMGNVVPIANDPYPAADDTYATSAPSGTNPRPGSPMAAADPTVPSWDNCQIRISSNNATATSDQQFITLALQNTPTPVAPESPVTIALPVAGAAVLVGGGLIFTRRRRRAARVA